MVLKNAETNFDNMTIGDVPVANLPVNKGDQSIAGNLWVGGTVLAGSSENETENLSISGALADGSTNKVLFTPGRAGTIKAIKVACAVPPASGTNTLKVRKNGATTLISTASIDPTTLVAYVATALTLSGTAASLAFTATDTIELELVAGTQGTAMVAPSAQIEWQPTTDF